MLIPMAQPATEAIPNEKLESALAAFDRARGPEEYQATQERVCSLGPEVIPGVISALSEAQGPERSDLLVTLIHKWMRLDDVLHLAGHADSNWLLRASLAEALPHFVDDLHPSEARQRQRIGSMLASLARDPDVGVRITAVEAIGSARLREQPEVAGALRIAASSDPNASVREEARRILDGT